MEYENPTANNGRDRRFAYLFCEKIHAPGLRPDHALRDVSVHVEQGEIVTLIGANGAGKLTLLRTASGMVRAKSGSVNFLTEEIGKASIASIVSRGLIHCPEGRRIFANLTVKENLEARGVPAQRQGRNRRRLRARPELFPACARAFDTGCGRFPAGTKMLAIGRALMSRPKLLMLDEPIPRPGAGHRARYLPNY
ncbi:MAG: ATP-binding cassette domain-containing protein [Armatimonas sp.]